MRKLIAIVAAFACLNVMADDCACEEVSAANPFEGFSAYLDLDYAHSDANGSCETKLNNIAATLGATYRYNMGDNWLVGAGADITFGKKDKDVTVVAPAANDCTVTANLNIKKLVVSPSLYLSFGKGFDNVLVEILAGASYAGAKADYDYNVAKNKDNTTTATGKGCLKARKVTPMLGLRVAYAFNQNVSAYLTGRYMFNVKKSNDHIALDSEKVFVLGAGIAYKF